jgi:hypothetical protein
MMRTKSSSVSSSLRADVIAACSVATFVGLLGLLPHVVFSYQIGEFHYFQGAYDEDSYVLAWLRDGLRSTRALSGFCMSVLYAITHGSLDVTLALADFAFPFLISCAAYFAASQVVTGRAARILATLLLVFANDLLSLGNQTIWMNPRFNLAGFKQVVDLFGANLVPSYETSFLAIFRTPEPQVSFLLLFVILGLLARFAQNARSASLAARIALIASVSLLPLCYTFVAMPVAAIAAITLAGFAWSRQKAAAIATAAGLLGMVCVAIVATLWQHGAGQSTESLATGLSYHSRAPIITPAVIASLLSAVAFGAWALKRNCLSPLVVLALSCLALPFVLSNQQVISGIMISARDWERTISYPLLVFGALVALSLAVKSIELRRSRITAIATILALGCGVIVLGAQLKAFHMWRPYNIEAISIVRALKSVDPAVLASSRLTFEQAPISQSIQVRMNDTIDVPLTFYKVAMNFIPNMGADAKLADPSSYETLVFEHWLRTGVGPEKADQILRTEITQRAGTFTNYLFSFRDAWYPASDNRAVRPKELERSVAGIIQRYETYIREKNAIGALAQPSLLISARPLGSPPALPWIRNELLGSGEAEGVKAYVYRQEMLSGPPVKEQ